MGPFDHAESGGSDAQPETGKVVGSVAELWRYPSSGSTPRSGTQVSSVSVIKSSSTVQEWPNRPVGSPVVP